MRVLGIETSCDETAVCLIDASGTTDDFSYAVLGNTLYSQAALHAQYGGVFPNLAKREHAKNFVPLLEDTLRQADCLTEAYADISAYRSAMSTLLESRNYSRDFGRSLKSTRLRQSTRLPSRWDLASSPRYG
jgi:hypothetical protein